MQRKASLWPMVQGGTPSAASSPSSDRDALAARYFASAFGAPATAIGLIPAREYLAYFESHLCGSQVLQVEC